MSPSATQWERVLAGASAGERFIVLDVDRTIIDTTAWFHACMTPGLLLQTESVPAFEDLNARRFATSPTLADDAFRRQTLALIEPQVSAQFLDRLAELPRWASLFRLGKPTDALRLFVAGQITARRVGHHADFLHVLRLHRRLRADQLRVLFLSSGYRPFIEGVVSEVLGSAAAGLRFDIVASELDFRDGRAIETEHVDQFRKETFVQALLDRRVKIDLLADDSPENPGLFTAVESAGGVALRIQHTGRGARNPTWAAHLASMRAITPEGLGRLVPSIAAKPPDLPPFVSLLGGLTDAAGIARLPTGRFEAALVRLSDRLTAPADRLELQRAFGDLTTEAGGVRLLRGTAYYGWLPPHLHPRLEPLERRLVHQAQLALRAYSIVRGANLLQADDLNDDERLLLFVILDHLINSTVCAIHMLEQRELSGGLVDTLDVGSALSALADHLFDLTYALFSGTSRVDVDAGAPVRAADALDAVLKSPEGFRGMRELDHPVVLYATAARIMEHQVDGQGYDYLVSFPYGGIELGFAVRALHRLRHPERPPPALAHCHFSSKKEMRGECGPVDYASDHWLDPFVPARYATALSDMRSGGRRVLLVDNNVTTFASLARVKAVCARWGNEAHAAVAAINYENIRRYIVEEAPYEPLDPAWARVLDIPPVGDYVTAFNTWGTCEKSRTLTAAFQSLPAPSIAMPHRRVLSRGFVFKACRVHNVYDLAVVLAAGANMIGLHAVYPDAFDYLRRQTPFGPSSLDHAFDPALPLAWLEIESIRLLQASAPAGLRQALLFEEALPPEAIGACCAAYGMDPPAIWIQLQHRTTADHLRQVRSRLGCGLIAAAGLQQTDLGAYLAALSPALNPDRDFVLLDMSKHQPDLIARRAAPVTLEEKRRWLVRAAAALRGLDVPLLLADDIPPEDMTAAAEVLIREGVCVAGFDTQNILELPAHEQAYASLRSDGGVAPARIRKCVSRANAWGDSVRRWADRRTLVRSTRLSHAG